MKLNQSVLLAGSFAPGLASQSSFQRIALTTLDSVNCNLSIAFEAKAFDLIPLNFSTKLTIGGISGLDRNFAKIIPTAEQKIADEG